MAGFDQMVLIVDRLVAAEYPGRPRRRRFPLRVAAIVSKYFIKGAALADFTSIFDSLRVLCAEIRSRFVRDAVEWWTCEWWLNAFFPPT